jgi:glycosyltransferase involved in cell wall biosynthesis
MSVAKLRILIALCLLAGIGLIAYPAAVWLHSELVAWMRAPVTSAQLGGAAAPSTVVPAGGNLGFYLPFPVAFFAACVGLKGQLRNLVAGWIGAAVRGAVLVTVATCLLWIGLLFAFSLLVSLDRLFVATLFVATLSLLICVRFVLGLVRPSGWTAIGGIGAVLAVGYGVPAEQAILRSTVATLMGLSMLVSFSVLGGALARRGSAAATELIICIFAGFVLFVAGSFFLGTLAAVPRSLLLVSFLVAVILGLVPILLEALFGPREGNPTLYHPGQSLQPGAWAELERPSAASATGNAVWIVQRGEGSLARLHFLAGALADAGRSVVVCVPAALAGQIKQGPWAVVSLPKIVPLRLRTTAVLALLRGAARLFALGDEEKARQLAYERRPRTLHDKASLRRFAADHPELRPAVVICADWEGGPVAEVFARGVNAKLVYDVSEHEPDQYFNDARWVANEAPVAATVAATAQRAATLTIVAAEALRARVRGRNPGGGEPLLVRTVPVMATTPVFRPIDGRIHLLYSGDIVGAVGIEALVDAMTTVRVRYRLTLSGQADHGFLGDLKRRITKLGLDEDVAIDLLDAPVDERADALADAGIVLCSLDTPKAAYAVPEQLFEHVQAGRAVFLIGSGEAAELVREAKIGYVIGDRKAADIGAALDAVGVSEIEACKRAAVGAAAEMNRMHFGHKLVVEL